MPRRINSVRTGWGDRFFQDGVLFGEATDGLNGSTDPMIYSDITRNLNEATSGQAWKSADIVSRFNGITSLNDLSLNGLHVINRYGATGAGGGDVQTGLAIGGYSEYRGGTQITGALYGAELATTMYNSGTVASMFGSLNTAQINGGSSGVVTTLRGAQCLARINSSAAGTVTNAYGVEGYAGMQDTASGTITNAIGGQFGALKDAGVLGTITNAYGVNILAVTQGGTNNFGLRIAAAASGSGTNQSLRVDGGEAHFICPVTSPIVTFTDADTTPSVAGSNVFKCSNTNPTNLTDFDTERDGQEIKVIFTNANTTVKHNASLIINRSGVDVTPGANTTRSYVTAGGIWYETS